MGEVVEGWNGLRWVVEPAVRDGGTLPRMSGVSTPPNDWAFHIVLLHGWMVESGSETIWGEARGHREGDDGTCRGWRCRYHAGVRRGVEGGGRGGIAPPPIQYSVVHGCMKSGVGRCRCRGL